MKLIYKIFSLNSNFIRYFILITLLLLVFYLTSTLNVTTSNTILKKNNTLDNRRVSIILNDEVDVNIFNDISYLKEIKKLETEEYELIFTDYRDIKTFTNNFSNYYSTITFYGDSSENESVLSYLKTISTITSYIVLGILFIVITIGIIQSFLEFIPDISLLKLLGYSNNLIIRSITIFFTLSFTCFFIFSYLLFKLFILIINTIFNYLNLNFMLLNLNIQLIIMLYIFLLIFILIIVCCLYFKLKKITPISFLKNNLSL